MPRASRFPSWAGGRDAAPEAWGPAPVAPNRGRFRRRPEVRWREAIGTVSFCAADTKAGKSEPRRRDREHGDDRRKDERRRNACPSVLCVNQRVDETQNADKKQKEKIEDRHRPAPTGPEQFDQRPEQRNTPEHQAARDQPESEILPLDLIALIISDVAEQRAQEQRNCSGQQDRMKRVERSQSFPVWIFSHSRIPPCCWGTKSRTHNHGRSPVQPSIIENAGKVH